MAHGSVVVVCIRCQQDFRTYASYLKDRRGQICPKCQESDKQALPTGRKRAGNYVRTAKPLRAEELPEDLRQYYDIDNQFTPDKQNMYIWRSCRICGERRTVKVNWIRK